MLQWEYYIRNSKVSEVKLVVAVKIFSSGRHGPLHYDYLS